jgi:hypothetical protein
LWIYKSKFYISEAKMFTQHKQETALLDKNFNLVDFRCSNERLIFKYAGNKHFLVTQYKIKHASKFIIYNHLTTAANIHSKDRFLFFQCNDVLEK